MRPRTIAGTPAQSASAAWKDIADLIANTLERSADIDRADVERTMAAAAGAGRSLIAAGQLADHPIVVVGDNDFRLQITVTSGDKAMGVEHNTKPVPGGASASSWMVHLPAVGALAPVVIAVARTDTHLSSDEPVTPVAGTESKASESTIETAALEAWAGEQR